MNEQPKEMVESTDDSCMSVFARPRPLDLAADDLEYIAGGRRAMIDPNG